MRGSTGTLTLSGVNSVPTVSNPLGDAVKNETIIAGSDTLTARDGVGPGVNGFFALTFSGVTFSGSQFRLYIGTDGFSQIGSTDIAYGPTFNVADFSTDCSVACKQVNSTLPGVGAVSYYIGNYGGEDLVEGPIPIQISSSYNYIKVFDGSTTSVAVGGFLIIQAGLSITPTEGPAGTSVTVNGGGFPSSKTVDLRYSYSYTFFNGTLLAVGPKNWTTGVSTGPGYFNFTGPIADVKQQINPTSGVIETVAITIDAALEPTPHTVYATTSFTEDNMFVSQVLTLDETGALLDGTSAPFVTSNKYGSWNGTTGGAVTVFTDVSGVSLGQVIIAGNDSAVGATVTFTVGGTQVGSAVADANGNWNGTGTLGTLSLGEHTLYVSDGATILWFQINIGPSLVLSVYHGAEGSTVTAQVYGFPTNSDVWIYWDEITWGDGTAYNLVNGTTNSQGTFASPLTFTVPNSFGVLFHVVYAIENTSTAFLGATADNSTVSTYVLGPTAARDFTIDSTFSVSPTSTADDGSTILATATGLLPGCTNSGFENNLGNDCDVMAAQLTAMNYDGSFLYAPSLDNFPLATSSSNVGSEIPPLMPNSTGGLTISIPAAGFRPGLHVLALNNGLGGHQLLQWQTNFATDNVLTTGNYGPGLWATFTITTTGDPISDQVAALGTTISGLSSSLSSIQSSLSDIQSSLSGITSSLATITSDVSGLSSSLSSISTKLDTITTSLSSISSTLNTAAASAAQAATSAGQAATQAQAAATAATNAVNGNSQAQTYVLVVAVLAAITLVLELAILVRKLS